MGHWLTIEVQHAMSSAYRWRDSWADALLEAALTHGVRDWAWQTPDWGVILELEFSSEDNRDAFPGLPLVRAALDAAPDAVLGVFVIPGRGGSQGAAVRRRPRPSPFAEGACAQADSEELLVVRGLPGGPQTPRFPPGPAPRWSEPGGIATRRVGPDQAVTVGPDQPVIRRPGPHTRNLVSYEHESRTAEYPCPRTEFTTPIVIIMSGWA